MTATILPFSRARAALRDANRDATLRRVRFAARHAGCDGQDVITVESYGAALLDNGHTPDAVVQAARSFAAQLHTQPPALD